MVIIIHRRQWSSFLNYRIRTVVPIHFPLNPWEQLECGQRGREGLSWADSVGCLVQALKRDARFSLCIRNEITPSLFFSTAKLTARMKESQIAIHRDCNWFSFTSSWKDLTIFFSMKIYPLCWLVACLVYLFIHRIHRFFDSPRVKLEEIEFRRGKES